MRKLKKKIDLVFTWIGIFFFLCLSVVMVSNVIVRLFGKGIPWFAEVSQYLNVWCTFATGVALSVSGQHLRIEAIDGLFKGKLKVIPRIIAHITVLVFYVGLTYATFLLATKSRQVISTLTSVPMAAVYWPICIMSALSAVSAVIGIAAELTPPDPGEEENKMLEGLML